MKNLENFGVQEMNADEIKSSKGGCPICVAGLHDELDPIGYAIGDAIVDAGQWVLGLFAGIGDGINAGMDD